MVDPSNNLAGGGRNGEDFDASAVFERRGTRMCFFFDYGGDGYGLRGGRTNPLRNEGSMERREVVSAPMVLRLGRQRGGKR